MPPNIYVNNTSTYFASERFLQHNEATCVYFTGPVVTYVWLHILRAENVGGFGLMSMILYSLGIHLSIYGTTGPKVEGTWMQLSFIAGMPADALGLAAIQRLFQGEHFSLQRLANRWFYAAIR